MDHRTSQIVDHMSPSNNMHQQQQQQQQQHQQQQNIQQQQQRVQQQIGAQNVMPGVMREANSLASGVTSMAQQQHNATTAMTTPLMMNLMTNLFPPAAMLSNSGAFLAMPEAFAMSGGSINPSAHQQSALGGTGIASNQTGLVSLPSGVAMPSTASLMSADNDNSLSSSIGVPQPSSQAATAQQSGQTRIAPSMNPPALPPYNLSTTGGAHSMGHSSVGPGISSYQATAPASSNASVAAGELDDREKKGRPCRPELSAEQKAKQNRDRNREHARSTRLRKKAYVQKLKELVECLHAERTEEVRQRRVAIQHLAEKQNVRRNVVRNFLRFHATTYERDSRKWGTILEDDFWLKQPVTPYRSFRRAEIQQVNMVHDFL